MGSTFRVVNRLLLGGAAAVLFVTTIQGQSVLGPPSEANHFIETPKGWTPPKTPWGEPDLRGVWNTATYTRLQRPQELGTKAFYTEEEAIAEYKKAAESDAEVDPRTVHYDWKEYAMDAWQGGTRPNLRTSLIVDPENGRRRHRGSVLLPEPGIPDHRHAVEQRRADHPGG